MRHLNPVYKRELKQTARTKRTLAMLCIYNLLMAAFGLFMLYLTFDNGVLQRGGVKHVSILTWYAIMGGLEFFMVLLIIPAVTAGAIAGEREKQTLDILLSSGISPLQIVMGKLAASISMVILLAISSLPIISVVFSIGGIMLEDVLQLFLLIVVTAVYLGSIGVFFSVFCKKTTIATVSSYLAMIVLSFLLPLSFSFSEMFSFFGNASYFSMRQFGESFAGRRSIMLLFNPLMSFISLLRNQTGRGITIMNSIGSGGGIMYFLSRNWLSASMMFQLLVSAALIALSAHQLNPFRAGKWKRK